MEKINYKGLGFKSGIEIHQQLETRKLFCNCESIVHDTNPEITIVRKLRAVAGELEKVDIAAAHEVRKEREFVYEACPTSCCLVELDEEPPHEVNQEALKASLQIAKLLNAEIVDEIQFMRKTVVDGSNVSGFQRTALIARNGYVETSKGKVGIPTVCLEEEAAKRVKEDKKSVTFRLDRLGIPLIEIATDPDIVDAEHAKETAEKIGMILRSSGKVKRGLGTIRQDVNVSIKGHPRIEIKGFQDLKSIPKVVNYEIERQIKAMRGRKKPEPHVRKAEPDGTTSFLRPMPGAARMYPETDAAPILPGAVKVEKVELIEDKINALKKFNIEEGVAKAFVKEGKDKQLLDYFKKYPNVKPAFITQTLNTAVAQVKKEFNADINPSQEDFETLFNELNKGKISKDSVLRILKENKPVREIISKFELMPDAELEKELNKIIAENKALPFKALIGKAMARLKGKADGKKIVQMLQKLSS